MDKKKVPNVVVKCRRCGKRQYVREDSWCTIDNLCASCEVKQRSFDNVPQAQESKLYPITRCKCGAGTTQKCVGYECSRCMSKNNQR